MFHVDAMLLFQVGIIRIVEGLVWLPLGHFRRIPNKRKLVREHGKPNPPIGPQKGLITKIQLCP